LFNNVTNQILDNGTDTELPTITVPFVDGSNPAQSGYLVTAAAEYARTFVFLPLHVQQVLRMKVHARSVILEAHQMQLEIKTYGGADNESYVTHAAATANVLSTSSNFAADDIIYWTYTAAGLIALVGGDSVQIEILFEDTVGDNIETDAWFRTVSFEYV